MDDKLNEMSEAQFREFMMQQLEAGHKNMAELRSLIEENTKMTAGIVNIIKFSDNSARRIVKTGRFLSAAAKILLPIVMLYGAIRGVQTGHWPSLKDLL